MLWRHPIDQKYFSKIDQKYFSEFSRVFPTDWPQATTPARSHQKIVSQKMESNAAVDFQFHVNAVLFQVKQNTKYNHKIHVKMLILKQWNHWASKQEIGLNQATGFRMLFQQIIQNT